MKLKDVMTKDVKVISPDSPLQEAAKLMRSLDCGALPVCRADRLVGMVTDRDLVVRALAEEIDVTTMKVADCMTTPLTFCYEDEGVDEVASLMKRQKIRRVPILNRSKRLVGIVALGDLAMDAPQHEATHEVLHKLSESDKKVA